MANSIYESDTAYGNKNKATVVGPIKIQHFRDSFVDQTKNFSEQQPPRIRQLSKMN